MSSKKTILQKLNHIEYLDPNNLIEELSNLPTVKEKVQHIVEVNKEHYDKYEVALRGLNEDEKDYYQKHKEDFQTKFFGSRLIDKMLVFHEPVYEEIFLPFENSYEFKCQIHLSLAKKGFERIKNSSDFQSELKSDIREEHINKRLTILNKEQRASISLYSDSTIDLRKDTSNLNHKRNIEILRVIDGIYEREELEAVSWGAMILAMTNYKFLKPYLEKLLLDNEKVENESMQSQYSALEWATIFYYADETKLLPVNNFVIERMKQFLKVHKIPTTLASFKSKYYNAKNRINKNNNYPIEKLESIIPFLKEHYSQTVTKVENDIIILESEKSEYQ